MPGCAAAGGHPPAGLPRARLSGRGRCRRLRTRRQPPSGTRRRRRSGEQRGRGPSSCPDTPAEPSGTPGPRANGLALALRPPRGGRSGPWLYQGGAGHAGPSVRAGLRAARAGRRPCGDGRPVHHAACRAATCRAEQSWPRGAGTLLSPPVGEAAGGLRGRRGVALPALAAGRQGLCAGVRGRARLHQGGRRGGTALGTLQPPEGAQLG